jgi:hypothetical protein
MEHRPVGVLDDILPNSVTARILFFASLLLLLYSIYWIGSFFLRRCRAKSEPSSAPPVAASAAISATPVAAAQVAQGTQVAQGAQGTTQAAPPDVYGKFRSETSNGSALRFRPRPTDASSTVDGNVPSTTSKVIAVSADLKRWM